VIPPLALVLLISFYPVSVPHLNYLYILGRTVVTPLCYLAAAASIHHYVVFPNRVLNLKTVEYLGKISYSMYLWQQMVTNVEKTGPYERFGIWVDVPIAWAAILLVSVLSYEFLEKPSLKLRRFVQRSPRSPDPVGAAARLNGKEEAA
jgi:peptidoglycan/LPS O-acetylase OafA/YrhL